MLNLKWERLKTFMRGKWSIDKKIKEIKPNKLMFSYINSPIKLVKQYKIFPSQISLRIVKKRK